MKEENNEVIKEKKKKNYLLLFLKRNKIKTLLFLFIALVANTYAWFIYNRVVSTNLEAHVKSWQVTIDGAMDETITFEIDDLYPGMPEYSDSVTLTNGGEMDAQVSFSIKSIRIMDETYTVGVNGETVESLKTRLANYPFSITIESSNELVESGGGQADLHLYVEWEFGDGDATKDALDTYWGEKSYDYSQTNPTKPSIEIEVNVNAEQVNN